MSIPFKIAVLLSFLFLLKISKAQNPQHSQISILTVSPGAELYNAFGHSGIRVKDTISGLDEVYNYGIFNFRQPNFYTNFIKGKLLYQLGKSSTARFLRSYERQGRSVTEQTAQLSENEKQKIISFLKHNYLPENRAYLYDFFFDNCASRIRDVFENELGKENFSYAITIFEERSFREMLDVYTKDNGRLWADFGMDLILGLPSDKSCDFRDQMFLPEFLMKNMASISIGNKNLLSAKKQILLAQPKEISRLFISPFLATLIFLLLAVMVTFFTKSIAVKNIFDGSMLTILGLSGLLFLSMWLFTDHQVCHKNLNMLWANPLYLLFPFIFKKRFFWLWILAATALVLLAFPIFPQKLHLAFIPILFGIVIRSLQRFGLFSK